MERAFPAAAGVDLVVESPILPKVIQLRVRSKMQIQVCSRQSHLTITPLLCIQLSKVEVGDTGWWEGVLRPD